MSERITPEFKIGLEVLAVILFWILGLLGVGYLLLKLYVIIK